MPYYLLEAIDSNGFVRSEIVKYVSEPTLKVLREYLELSQEKYETKIEKLSDCYGCAYECGGQKDHDECPDGCLHDQTSCSFCN